VLGHLQLGPLVRKSDVSPRLFTGLLLSVTLLAAFLSDRYESRGITAALVTMLAVTGFSLYLGKKGLFT
jgi:hypothetical protein